MILANLFLCIDLATLLALCIYDLELILVQFLDQSVNPLKAVPKLYTSSVWLIPKGSAPPKRTHENSTPFKISYFLFFTGNIHSRINFLPSPSYSVVAGHIWFPAIPAFP